MKILAIDTSSKICSVAILEDNEKIEELNINDGKTHSENLMPLIDEILKKSNIKLKDIELFACSVGPGSFTGIRIGVATIKAIAEVSKKKIASVTSLETLAQNINSNDKKTIVSLIDARNNQVYAGIFDENYNLKEDYIADDINFVIEKMKKYEDIICVGDGAVLHKELLKSQISNIEFIEDNNQTAVNVGKIGYKKYLENNLCNSDTIVPIYLRKSQAERMKNKS